MRVNTQNSNVSANRRIRLPISPSRRDDRRICDRRLHTVFNKACDLWLRLQKQAPSRLAVMVEMDGSLQVFLSTYDALDNDWPPTREDVISRGTITRPHNLKTIDELVNHSVEMPENMWRSNGATTATTGDHQSQQLAPYLEPTDVFDPNLDLSSGYHESAVATSPPASLVFSSSTPMHHIEDIAPEPKTVNPAHLDTPTKTRQVDETTKPSTRSHSKIGPTDTSNEERPTKRSKLYKGQL